MSGPVHTTSCSTLIGRVIQHKIVSYNIVTCEWSHPSVCANACRMLRIMGLRLPASPTRGVRKDGVAVGVSSAAAENFSLICNDKHDVKRRQKVKDITLKMMRCDVCS
jgi:hypothetical protein